MTNKNTKSIDDIVLVTIITLSFSPVFIYLFSDKFQSPVPPALIAFMMSAGISALVYRFLGGIPTSTSFQAGAIKVGGSMAALLASWYLLNTALVDQSSVDVSSLQTELSTLKIAIERQEDEIRSKNQTIEEQANTIQEFEARLAEMNKDIAMNPSAAISFLPYALRKIGADDGTIDCATFHSDALKDLACQQIQTLLNSVDSSYELNGQRDQVRSQVARYQSEHGLNMGKSERKAGMLDDQTLRFLVQERLTDIGSERKPEDYFP